MTERARQDAIREGAKSGRQVPVRLLVCGGRDYIGPLVIRRELEAVARIAPIAAVIHGGARGADNQGDAAARSLGFEVEVYPANWREHGKAAGPMRNKLMLGTHPDLVLAFKDGFDYSLARGGTEHMVGIALDADVPCKVIDGEQAWWVDRTTWGCRPRQSRNDPSRVTSQDTTPRVVPLSDGQP